MKGYTESDTLTILQFVYNKQIQKNKDEHKQKMKTDREGSFRSWGVFIMFINFMVIVTMLLIYFN